MERQLEAALRDVTRLTAENESLMDISNALAAEKRQASEELGALREQGKHDPLIRHMANTCHRLLSHSIVLLGLPGQPDMMS